MIVDPDRYIKTFADLGAILSVHYEACTHLHRVTGYKKGMKAGVAINPHTNIDLLEDTINDIDLVCIMSVNPGFGGQSFIENTYAKVKKLKELHYKRCVYDYRSGRWRNQQKSKTVSGSRSRCSGCWKLYIQS
jgi:ribulose-phosphate 3-epimerase